MNCKDCGKPVHWAEEGTEGGGAWYHETSLAAITCPAQGMVEMILSGPAA